MDNSPRTIFVTGVSSGIGYGLAQYYVQQGHEVLGVSRREPSDLVEAENFHFVSCDVADDKLVSQRLPDLMAGRSSLDLVILNAGILGCFGDLGEAELADLKKTMQTNVWANKLILDTLYQTCHLRLTQVVAISSGAAVNGNRGWSGYSISKAALNMLIKLYAREQPDTHFCAFAPGLVDTAIQDTLCERIPDPRFPAVETLRSKRGTAEMPVPEVAAKQLATAMERLPELVDSGEYADIRSLV